MSYPARGPIAGVEVIDGLDLSVGRSEMVVLSGRSGSGKTTALRIAAGLLSPTRGTVRWSGLEINTLDPARRARERGRFVGYVFQGAGLIDSLTAEENVALPGVPRRIRNANDRAREMLSLVGLATRARHFPHELSGGEQQRVAIARALFGEPALLLVDEPTANLDRATANGVIELCQQLVTSGVGALIASHDLVFGDYATRTYRLE